MDEEEQPKDYAETPMALVWLIVMVTSGVLSGLFLFELYGLIGDARAAIRLWVRGMV